MPSIFDIFAEGDPALADDDAGAEIDPVGFDQVLDSVLKNRPVAGRPVGYDPSTDGGASAPVSDGEVAGTEGGEVPASIQPGAPAPPAPVEPVAETPPPPADPLGGLSDLERLELSQLRQALNDPERSMAVRRALLGVEPAAPAVPVAAAPSAPPAAPEMPEEIMPGSVEAQLWQSNQDLQRQMAELQTNMQAGRQQTEAEARNAAAVRATNAFGTKYAGRLSEQEIMAIAQTAGMRKLPDAFRPTVNNWDEAMTQSLEFELRSNDALLGKVLGSPLPGAAAATAPTGQRPPEGQAAGRKLTALSSAASPSGEAAVRTPLEHRGDGKLTEKSRLQLVQELVSGDGSLRGTPGEGIS